MKGKKDKEEENEKKKKGCGGKEVKDEDVRDEDGRDEDGGDEDLGRSQYREPEQSRSLTQSDSCEDTGK